MPDHHLMQYRSPWGLVRVGKLLEDLDSLAGNVAFRHWYATFSAACYPVDACHAVSALPVDRSRYN